MSKRTTYDPDKDVVVQDFGDIEVKGNQFRIEARSYDNHPRKLVVSSIWQGRTKRLNGIPISVGKHILARGILEEFVNGVTI